MGVVSNKVDITELKKGGGGTGDLPGRVTALEAETANIYSSVNALSKVVLDPVTGLKDRVEKLEEGIKCKTFYSAVGDGTLNINDAIHAIMAEVAEWITTLPDGTIIMPSLLYIAISGSVSGISVTGLTLVGSGAYIKGLNISSTFTFNFYKANISALNDTMAMEILASAPTNPNNDIGLIATKVNRTSGAYSATPLDISAFKVYTGERAEIVVEYI